MTEENIGSSNEPAPDACADVHYTYDRHQGPEHWSDLVQAAQHEASARQARSTSKWSDRTYVNRIRKC